jgi:hypothetical protein
LIGEGFDFKLVLLGKPTDQKTIKKFDDLGENVKTYDSFVPEKEFDKQMFSSDLILNNIRKKFMLDNTVEQYGKTKETGINFSIIRYSTPGIVSEKFEVMKEIEDSYFRYKDEKGLYNRLKEIIKNDRLIEAKREKCKKNSLQFSPSNLCDEFYSELNREIKKE